MAWTTPSVRATGDLITASIWNADLVADLNYLRLSPGDYKVSAQTADHNFWLLCDGTAVNRTTYADLFTVVSTSFGVGDGSTTFNLPDARGRTLSMIGTHTSVDALNDNDGVAVGNRSPSHNTTNSLTLPNHTHSHTLTLPNHVHAQATSYDSGSTTYNPVANTNNSGAHAFNTGNPSTNPAIDGAVGNPASNPAIGGSAGPGGTLPIDTPAYIVAGRLFIHY